jgi:predicted RNA-binding Zn-ribbon protein involved in translation (DUF1610 family)
MTEWLNRAMNFEPSFEMRKRLEKNRETFAQYIVRVMSYSCPTCGALPMAPCDERIASSGSCGVQFHRERARAAKCPVTRTFLETLEGYR